MISLERLLATVALISSLGFSSQALGQRGMWDPHRTSGTYEEFLESRHNVYKIPRIDEVIKNLSSEVEMHEETEYFVHLFFSKGNPAIMGREDLIVTEEEIKAFSDKTKGNGLYRVMVYLQPQSEGDDEQGEDHQGEFYSSEITDYIPLKRLKDKEFKERRISLEKLNEEREIYLESLEDEKHKEEYKNSFPNVRLVYIKWNLSVSEETVRKRMKSAGYDPMRIGWLEVNAFEAAQNPTKAVIVEAFYEPFYNGYTETYSYIGTETKISYRRHEIKKAKSEDSNQEPAPVKAVRDTKDK